MDFFDLHCDTPFKMYKENLPFSSEKLAVNISGEDCFKNWQQVFAVWVSESVKNPFAFYKRVLKNFNANKKEMPPNLTPHLAVEGGTVIENIASINELKADGVKSITLTWNGENKIAGGVNSSKGLTCFGKRVIKRMNGLKIATDLSHLNEKSFYGAIDVSEFPLATHSNCSAVLDAPRNLKREQLKLIAEKGGIIGLCFYPAFLGGDTFLKIYENIYYLLELGLMDNIAIGSDFDGADMDTRLMSVTDIPNLYFLLSEKGISDHVLKKIFYTNAERFFNKLK